MPTCIDRLRATVIAFSLLAGTAAAAPKPIPIPPREHGYSNFESTVLTSQKAFDEFLAKDSRAMELGWNDRSGFEKALREAKLDFDEQALVLIRHTEGSGSVSVRFQVLRTRRGRVLCQLIRKEPEVGTADLAAYCFALAVDKDRVRAVEVRLDGDKTAGFTSKKEIARFPLVLKIADGAAEEPAGGWSKAKTDAPAVVAAADFAVESAAKKTKGLKLVRIATARQQVVAGMNYQLVLRVSDSSGGEPVQRTAEAVVYRNLDDEQSLTSWKWRK